MTYDTRTGAVLFAKNFDRVARFYSVVLGLDEVHRESDHILLESPGFQLVVHRIVDGNPADGTVAAPVARRTTAAFKPVFFVPSISRLRGIAEAHGGVIEPADREWSFGGVTVCDAIDPDGNVIQFREEARLVPEEPASGSSSRALKVR
jgi:catechol 2,3-dioxygenase-like lactoylglutathione lyase family enzyme